MSAVTSGNPARQRALAVVLPALLTVVGYGVFVGLPAERAVRTAGRTAADPAARDARLAQQTRELATLTARRDALAAARRERLAGLATPRTARLARLTELLARHRLQVVRERPVSLTGRALEPALAQLLAWRGERAGESGGWSVELRGRYADVTAALTELADSPGLYPVRLELKDAAPAAGARLWTLVVWG